MTIELPDPDHVPPYAAMGRLDDRAILVAGAGAGIGRQTAHALAAAGARVACVDLTSDLAEAVAAEVGGVALVGDITDEQDVGRLLDEAVDALGPLTGIVDIVGSAQFVRIADMRQEHWDRAQLMNVQHALLLTRIGGERMASAGGGSLVFVASASGMSGSAYHAAYGMTKAALLSLVQTAAVELGPTGVRVNAVSPGIVWTPRMRDFIAEDHPKWAALGPLGRTAMPSDVASVALFLLSDLASYVTGQNLLLDGGVGVTSPYPIGDLYEKAQARG